jgi:hypothetical protein
MCYAPLTLNLLGRNDVTIEVNEHELDTTIHMKGEGLDFEIHIGQSNLDYLRQKLSPQGLIPDDFPMKIVMMNQLIEELEDIRDKEDPDWELSKVEYIGGDKDIIYFETREVQ